MAKERDWLDYVNTGADVIQTAQLSGIKGQLGSMAQLEDKREQRSAMLRRWRELLIVQDAKLDAALEVLETAPQAAYTTSRIVQWQFASLNFHPAVFEDWQDIDRAKLSIKRLNELLQKASPRVGKEFEEEVSFCLKFAEDLPALNELIMLAQQNDLRRSHYTEFVNLKVRLTRFPISYSSSYRRLKSIQKGFLVFAIIAGVVAFGIALFAPEYTYDNESESSQNPAIWIAYGVALLAFGCIGLLQLIVQRVQPKNTPEYDQLKQEVSRAGVISNREMSQPFDAQRWHTLAARFGGEGPQTKFVALLDEGKRRWNKFLAAAHEGRDGMTTNP
ncbi:MAG: hypothetical protein JWR19_821 [Pedosphaera sp.]|nr:hypothetical protein [Pedosphaera sp.]